MRISPSMNGGRPVTSSNRVQPTAYRSTRWVTFWPVICSGAMYSGVPRISVRRIDSSRMTRARPKSPSFTTFSDDTKMLAGLMSRWMTRRLWT